MTTQQIAGIATGLGSGLLTSLNAPKYVSGDVRAAGIAGMTRLGPVASFIGVAQAGSGSALGRLAIEHQITGNAIAGSLADLVSLGLRKNLDGSAQTGSGAALVWLSRGDQPLTGVAQTGSDGLLTLTVSAMIAGLAQAVTSALGDLGFTWPDLRQPLPGEVAGTVNLAINPSLEYGSLTGWSTDAGSVLTLDAGQALFGSTSAKLVTAADTSPAGHWVEVAGVAQLHSLGPVYGLLPQFVGSVGVFGDGGDVTLQTTIQYEDGTSLVGDPAPYATADGDWVWRSAPTVAADPERYVDRIVTRVVVPTGGAARTLRFDAAQIELDQGPGAGAYADGDQGGGFAWLGVPGRSPSIRQPRPE